MRVEVRLFAYFRSGREKKQFMELQEGAIAREVLNKLDIVEKEVSIFLINGRDGNADRVLSEGDVLALFPPVGGG
jgi:sulfur-carrier protein